MKEWAGKVPGLQTRADITHFARFGKTEFEIVLAQSDVQEVLATLKPGPLSPYWENQPEYLVAIAPPLPGDWLERPEIEKETLEKADVCRQNRQPLLVYGGAGAGKSTLMNWLYWHKYAEKEFGFERVWVWGEAGKSVTYWLGLIFRYFVRQESVKEIPTALAQLKAAWGQSPWLIALDNCDNVEVLRLLAESLPPGSLLATSARTSTGAPAHFPLNRSLEVTGAAEILALNLYRRLLVPVPPPAREWVQHINQAVRGNVLAMKLAFGLDVMEKLPQTDIARALETASPEEQISALLGMFSDRADAALAARALQLGLLPPLAGCDLAAFASLWETDDETAHQSLLELTRRGLLDPVENGWQAHESIRAFFAERWGASRSVGQDTWLERYFIRSNRAAWLEEQFRSMEYRWFWQNSSEQKRSWMLLSGQGKWEKEPRLTFRHTVISGLRSFRQESGLQWTVFSENSALFSSLTFVSGYALRRRMNTRRQEFNHLMAQAILGVFLVLTAGILATLLGIHAPAWVRNLALALVLLFSLGRAIVGMFTLTARIDTLYNYLWANLRLAREEA